jgi:hypothetical protein
MKIKVAQVDGAEPAILVRLSPYELGLMGHAICIYLCALSDNEDEVEAAKEAIMRHTADGSITSIIADLDKVHDQLCQARDTVRG